MQVPEVDLVDFTITELNTWIPLFIYEIRKQDGGLYRAKSVFEFLMTIQSIFATRMEIKYSFLKDPIFGPIKNGLDNTMRFLQAQGLGFNPMKAEVITEVMEESLWQENLLGKDTPAKLLTTLVYLLGINLGLRAGEHRKLRREMFQVR
jgi:hypothetical protein